MAVYPKKRSGKIVPNLHRVVVWVKNRRHERLVEGTKKDAQAFEARFRLELEAGPTVQAGRAGQTFSDFCVVRYRPHAETHLRATTWSVRQYHLTTLITTLVEPGARGRTLGEMKLTEIGTEHVEHYKAVRKAAGMKPRSINNELAVLRAIRTYARDLKVPIADFKIEDLPVVGRGRVTFWNDEQIARLFESIERYSADIMGPVVFLANTGCRKGEAIAAEKTWINMRRGLVEIPVNEYWQPKDNEPREIPIGDALRPWLERALATPGRWLFPSSRREEGKAPERFAYWPKRSFDRARKLAGRCATCIKGDPGGKKGTRCSRCAPQLRGGPHTLRHTFAAHFLHAVPDMYLLSKVLGHSETRTSAIYSHLLPSHMEKARNAVNLSPATGPAKLEARKRWSGR